MNVEDLIICDVLYVAQIFHADAFLRSCENFQNFAFILKEDMNAVLYREFLQYNLLFASDDIFLFIPVSIFLKIFSLFLIFNQYLWYKGLILHIEEFHLVSFQKIYFYVKVTA